MRVAKRRSFEQIVSQKQFRLNPAYLVDEPQDESGATRAVAAVTFDIESIQKRVVEGDDASEKADSLAKAQDQSPKLRVE